MSSSIFTITFKYSSLCQWPQTLTFCHHNFLLQYYLVNVAANHVQDCVEHLHIQLFHCKQFLLGLVEWQGAGVDSPQSGSSSMDDWRHGWSKIGPLALFKIIILEKFIKWRGWGFLLLHNWTFLQEMYAN